MCPTGRQVTGFDAHGDIVCNVIAPPPPPPPPPTWQYTFTANVGQLAFQPTPVGQQAQLVVTLTNQGPDTGTPGAILANGNVAEFSVISGCLMVPPGGTCPVAVRFTPLTIGAKTAVLLISFPGQSLTISVSGTAT